MRSQCTIRIKRNWNKNVFVKPSSRVWLGSKKSSFCNSAIKGMESPSIASQITEQLTCPICLEPFKAPKFLSCLHTFCADCLESLLLQKNPSPNNSCSQITCPTCRAVTPLHPQSKDGIKNLTTNFFINNLLPLVSQLSDTKLSDQPNNSSNNSNDIPVKKNTGNNSSNTSNTPSPYYKCSLCSEDEDDPAVSICTDCNQLLCDLHFKSHKKSKDTTNHTTVRLDEAADIDRYCEKVKNYNLNNNPVRIALIIIIII